MTKQTCFLTPQADKTPEDGSIHRRRRVAEQPNSLFSGRLNLTIFQNRTCGCRLAVNMYLSAAFVKGMSDKKIIRNTPELLDGELHIPIVVSHIVLECRHSVLYVWMMLTSAPAPFSRDQGRQDTSLPRISSILATCAPNLFRKTDRSFVQSKVVGQCRRGRNVRVKDSESLLCFPRLLSKGSIGVNNMPRYTADVLIVSHQVEVVEITEKRANIADGTHPLQCGKLCALSFES